MPLGESQATHVNPASYLNDFISHPLPPPSPPLLPPLRIEFTAMLVKLGMAPTLGEGSDKRSNKENEIV